MKKKIIVFLLITIGFSLKTFAANYHGNHLYTQFGLGDYLNHSHSERGPSVVGISGYNLNEYFSVQLTANYMNNQTAILTEGKLNLFNYYKFTPHLLLGAGYMDIGENSFGIDIGFGIKYSFIPTAYMFADYRYLQSFASNKLNASMVILGVGLYFTDTLDINSVDKFDKNLSNITKCNKENIEISNQSDSCYAINNGMINVYLDVKFPYSSDLLDMKAKKSIDNLVDFMYKNHVEAINLQGFSSQGSKDPKFIQYNQTLSLNRAKQVKNYMISRGIDANNIEVAGHGYDNPIVPNTTKFNQSVNQRVEAKISISL